MNGIVILQARFDSTRLPGKVLLPINGRPMLEWQIRRIMRADIGEIVLATTTNSSDNELVELAKKLDISIYRGSGPNVLSRYVEIVQNKNPEYFVRLTGDCPFTMPDLLVEMNSEFHSRKMDYLSNTLDLTFPDGLDVEFVSSEALLELMHYSLGEKEKEHVTYGIYSRPSLFNLANFKSGGDFGHLRWTVDYPEDFRFIKDVFSHFEGRETTFKMEDILGLVKSGIVMDNEIPSSFRNISLRD